jgi:RNA polymerase sigma-70 factor (ECF subfamily)
VKANSLAPDIEALYRQHGPMVLRRCRALLRDEEVAVEAMQDVFVQLLRRRDSLHDAGLSSLLYTMATHTSLNLIRSRKKASGRVEGEEGEDLVEKIAGLSDRTEERTMAGQLLDRIFGRQPASSRLIATLHLVDGMTLEETAQEVGMSVSGVRKRLRALTEELGTVEAL